MEKIYRNLFWIISPTYKIAERNKRIKLAEDSTGKLLTEGIKRYNHYYLLTSVALAISYGILLGANRHNLEQLKFIRLVSAALIGYIITSRAIEIFTSFLLDATEKLNGRRSSSNLGFGDRLRLALNSYLEIMIGFGVIYYLAPNTFFSHEFKNIVEAIYFSAVTMTTVGYGDYYPQHWTSQLLVILQIFCSLTLALVCFTVYTTLALAGTSNKNQE
ncbi:MULTISPECIES: potassium channel family protein [Burkholderia]|uniref:potassium channel family protein n=1 Tax=Burkholderia TaxID=32008 RepID=UPI0009E38EBA|nr:MULTISPECIES: potassium channel family protein [Burkholderia]